MEGSILCIYAYFEKDQVCIDNLAYFLKYGCKEENVHYIIVVNGKCSVDINPGITVLKRENVGYDFGAFTYALATIPTDTYDYFMFLNSSVRGPFLKEDKWSYKFLQLLTNDVKLMGTTINVHETGPHVQSMFFAIDKECFNFLMTTTIFSPNHATFTMNDTVFQKEIKMSALVLQNGWNISCTARLYQGYDYRKIRQDFNPTSRHGDPHFKGAYFGGTVDQNEIVFIKTNRDVFFP